MRGEPTEEITMPSTSAPAIIIDPAEVCAVLLADGWYHLEEALELAPMKVRVGLGNQRVGLGFRFKGIGAASPTSVVREYSGPITSILAMKMKPSVIDA